VGWRVKVSGDREAKADQRHEGCDGMHDENRGQGMALGRGQGEVGTIVTSE
jgi:hypothetical protein